MAQDVFDGPDGALVKGVPLVTESQPIGPRLFVIDLDSEVFDHLLRILEMMIYLSIQILWRNLTGSWNRECCSAGAARVLSFLF